MCTQLNRSSIANAIAMSYNWAQYMKASFSLVRGGSSRRNDRGSQEGFTIIEVTLVLAISALLAVALLAGASANVDAQRYNSAVRDLESQVKQLIIAAKQGQTDRASVGDCPVDGSSADVGASNCILMGRVLTIEADGAYRAWTLVGKEPGGAPLADDLAAFRAYSPTLDPSQVTTGSLAWGTTLVHGGAPQAATIVILISPQTGAEFIRVAPTVIETTGDLRAWVNGASFSFDSETMICVDARGWHSPTMSLVVAPNAAGPSGVWLREETDAAATC